MGLVRARLIGREGPGRPPGSLPARRDALWLGHRSRRRHHVWHLVGATWGDGTVDPVNLIVGIATLRQGVYLADVLMLYALLVLAAPAALALLRYGRTDALVAGAVGLWGLHQLGLTAPLDAALVGLEWFPLLAWQLIFALGLAIGYHWRWLRAWTSRRRWGGALAGLVLAAVGLIGLSLWAPASPLAEPVAAFFARRCDPAGCWQRWSSSAPLRGGDAAVAPLRASLGWLLLPLGQQALLASPSISSWPPISPAEPPRLT
jgi:hypothetical protein